MEVDRLDKLISAYKQQNSNTLPEQLSLRMSMLSRAEGDLREIEREYRSTKEEIRSLEADQSGMGDENSKSLPALKAEYARLSAIYNESYPDMRVLKRKIEAMEKGGGAGNSTDAPSTAGGYKVQSRIASARARLEALSEQKKMLQNKIAQSEHAMVLTPTVEQGLDALVRDRDNAQKKYEEIHSKKMSAQIAESLESENKSERFTLLEPPLLPDRHFKPNRVKIIALGFLLALASAMGALLIMSSFDRQVRGIEALSHTLGHRPLAVIPYLFIEEEAVRKKRMIKWATIISSGVIITLLAALHFFYMPLNTLFVKIFARM